MWKYIIISYGSTVSFLQHHYHTSPFCHHPHYPIHSTCLDTSIQLDLKLLKAKTMSSLRSCLSKTTCIMYIQEIKHPVCQPQLVIFLKKIHHFLEICKDLCSFKLELDVPSMDSRNIILLLSEHFQYLTK